ncbi:MAG: FlgD immunoglobulin-like domain containing protein [Kiritimatiellae bacterium]|nr:FlgD immunoglobulin-like domain containing protein [Kiritimatiellia bacterium]
MDGSFTLTPLLIVAAYVLCIAVWFAESGRKNPIFAELWRRFRTLTFSGKLVAVGLLSSFIVYGSTKTNSPAPPLSLPPAASSGIVTNGFLLGGGGLLILESGGEPPAPPRLTTNQYLAGFALVKSLTNAAPWMTAPSNAVLHAPWTRYGVAEDTFWLPASNWSFTLGTNEVEGLHVSSSGTLSFGSPKGAPRADAMPDGDGLDFLAPLHTAIGVAPPGGRVWYAPTASNSLLIAWQEVFAGRDTNCPVTFQSELFANGDFTFRYDLSRLPTSDLRLPITNFAIGAQHRGGGETYAHDDTNKLVDGLELRWRAFGILDPDVDDHDGDGLSTYDEVMVHGTDPRLTDTDLDGCDDADELAQGYNPLHADTDADGLADGFDPAPLTWNDADADADGDGYPLWQELFYGSSDAVPGDVPDLFPDGYSVVTFTVTGAPTSGTVLSIDGRAVMLAGRTSFGLRFVPGTAKALALRDAVSVSVTPACGDCMVLKNRKGGLSAGGTGAGSAGMILPLADVYATEGRHCLHEADSGFGVYVTEGTQGEVRWFANGNQLEGTEPYRPQEGVPVGLLSVEYWPEDGNDRCCYDSLDFDRCLRGGICEHGLRYEVCQFCTVCSYWCYTHQERKATCPCLTCSGASGSLDGMLPPGKENIRTICVGSPEDTERWLTLNPCCDCPEHIGVSNLPKTNVVRSLSKVALWGSSDGTYPIRVGEKFEWPTIMFLEGTELSYVFGDARAKFSHDLHPDCPVTLAYTVAEIGLDAPDSNPLGYYQIRGGTDCVSRVAVLTVSYLIEGSVRLRSGPGPLRFSSAEGAAFADAHTNRVDAPPGSANGSRDFWLGASHGGWHTLIYELLNTSAEVRLTAELPVEAIVVKLATNVYVAAHGSPTPIVVDLAPASYDPAGYTLWLDGVQRASGFPPWPLAVSNLTAGTHDLTVRSVTFDDLADTALLHVIRGEIENAAPRDTDNIQVQYFTNSAGVFTYTAIPLQIYYRLQPDTGWVPDGVALHIKNPAGNTVRTVSLQASVGQQQTAWDGKDDSGNYVANGSNYVVEVAATIGGVSCVATNRLTVYEIRQGNCAYTPFLDIIDQYHCAIVFEYLGGNRTNDVDNLALYTVFEHPGQGGGNDTRIAPMTGHQWDYWCPPLTRNGRKAILERASALETLTIPYVSNWDFVFGNAIVHSDGTNSPAGDDWAGTINDIAQLRCDGAVEAAYEAVPVRLWGADAWWNVMSQGAGAGSNFQKHNAAFTGLTPARQRQDNDPDMTRNAADVLHIP